MEKKSHKHIKNTQNKHKIINTYASYSQFEKELMESHHSVNVSNECSNSSERNEETMATKKEPRFVNIMINIKAPLPSSSSKEAVVNSVVSKLHSISLRDSSTSSQSSSTCEFTMPTPIKVESFDELEGDYVSKDSYSQRIRNEYGFNIEQQIKPVDDDFLSIISDIGSSTVRCNDRILHCTDKNVRKLTFNEIEQTSNFCMQNKAVDVNQKQISTIEDLRNPSDLLHEESPLRTIEINIAPSVRKNLVGLDCETLPSSLELEQVQTHDKEQLYCSNNSISACQNQTSNTIPDKPVTSNSDTNKKKTRKKKRFARISGTESFESHDYDTHIETTKSDNESLAENPCEDSKMTSSNKTKQLPSKIVTSGALLHHDSSVNLEQQSRSVSITKRRELKRNKKQRATMAANDSVGFINSSDTMTTHEIIDIVMDTYNHDSKEESCVKIIDKKDANTDKHVTQKEIFSPVNPKNPDILTNISDKDKSLSSRNTNDIFRESTKILKDQSQEEIERLSDAAFTKVSQKENDDGILNASSDNKKPSSSKLEYSKDKSREINTTKTSSKHVHNHVLSDSSSDVSINVRSNNSKQIQSKTLQSITSQAFANLSGNEEKKENVPILFQTRDTFKKTHTSRNMKQGKNRVLSYSSSESDDTEFSLRSNDKQISSQLEPNQMSQKSSDKKVINSKSSKKPAPNILSDSSNINSRQICSKKMRGSKLPDSDVSSDDSSSDDETNTSLNLMKPKSRSYDSWDEKLRNLIDSKKQKYKSLDSEDCTSSDNDTFNTVNITNRSDSEDSLQELIKLRKTLRKDPNHIVLDCKNKAEEISCSQIEKTEKELVRNPNNDISEGNTKNETLNIVIEAYNKQYNINNFIVQSPKNVKESNWKTRSEKKTLSLQETKATLRSSSHNSSHSEVIAINEPPSESNEKNNSLSEITHHIHSAENDALTIKSPCKTSLINRFKNEMSTPKAKNILQCVKKNDDPTKETTTKNDTEKTLAISKRKTLPKDPNHVALDCKNVVEKTSDSRMEKTENQLPHNSNTKISAGNTEKAQESLNIVNFVVQSPKSVEGSNMKTRFKKKALSLEETKNSTNNVVLDNKATLQSSSHNSTNSKLIAINELPSESTEKNNDSTEVLHNIHSAENDALTIKVSCKKSLINTFINKTSTSQTNSILPCKSADPTKGTTTKNDTGSLSEKAMVLSKRQNENQNKRLEEIERNISEVSSQEILDIINEVFSKTYNQTKELKRCKSKKQKTKDVLHTNSQETKEKTLNIKTDENIKVTSNDEKNDGKKHKITDDSDNLNSAEEKQQNKSPRKTENESPRKTENEIATNPQNNKNVIRRRSPRKCVQIHSSDSPKSPTVFEGVDTKEQNKAIDKEIHNTTKQNAVMTKTNETIDEVMNEVDTLIRNEDVLLKPSRNTIPRVSSKRKQYIKVKFDFMKLRSRRKTIQKKDNSTSMNDLNKDINETTKNVNITKDEEIQKLALTKQKLTNLMREDASSDTLQQSSLTEKDRNDTSPDKDVTKIGSEAHSSNSDSVPLHSLSNNGFENGTRKSPRLKEKQCKQQDQDKHEVTTQQAAIEINSHSNKNNTIESGNVSIDNENELNSSMQSVSVLRKNDNLTKEESVQKLALNKQKLTNLMKDDTSNATLQQSNLIEKDRNDTCPDKDVTKIESEDHSSSSNSMSLNSPLNNNVFENGTRKSPRLKEKQCQRDEVQHDVTTQQATIKINSHSNEHNSIESANVSTDNEKELNSAMQSVSIPTKNDYPTKEKVQKLDLNNQKLTNLMKDDASSDTLQLTNSNLTEKDRNDTSSDSSSMSLCSPSTDDVFKHGTRKSPRIKEKQPKQQDQNQREDTSQQATRKRNRDSYENCTIESTNISVDKEDSVIQSVSTNIVGNSKNTTNRNIIDAIKDGVLNDTSPQLTLPANTSKSLHYDTVAMTRVSEGQNMSNSISLCAHINDAEINDSARSSIIMEKHKDEAEVTTQEPTILYSVTNDLQVNNSANTKSVVKENQREPDEDQIEVTNQQQIPTKSNIDTNESTIESEDITSWLQINKSFTPRKSSSLCITSQIDLRQQNEICLTKKDVQSNGKSIAEASKPECDNNVPTVASKVLMDHQILVTENDHFKDIDNENEHNIHDGRNSLLANSLESQLGNKITKGCDYNTSSINASQQTEADTNISLIIPGVDVEECMESFGIDKNILNDSLLVHCGTNSPDLDSTLKTNRFSDDSVEAQLMSKKRVKKRRLFDEQANKPSKRFKGDSNFKKTNSCSRPTVFNSSSRTSCQASTSPTASSTIPSTRKKISLNRKAKEKERTIKLIKKMFGEMLEKQFGKKRKTPKKRRQYKKDISSCEETSAESSVSSDEDYKRVRENKTEVNIQQPTSTKTNIERTGNDTYESEDIIPSSQISNNYKELILLPLISDAKVKKSTKRPSIIKKHQSKRGKNHIELTRQQETTTKRSIGTTENYAKVKKSNRPSIIKQHQSKTDKNHIELARQQETTTKNSMGTSEHNTVESEDITQDLQMNTSSTPGRNTSICIKSQIILRQPDEISFTKKDSQHKITQSIQPNISKSSQNKNTNNRTLDVASEVLRDKNTSRQTAKFSVDENILNDSLLVHYGTNSPNIDTTLDSDNTSNYYLETLFMSLCENARKRKQMVHEEDDHSPKRSRSEPNKTVSLEDSSSDTSLQTSSSTIGSNEDFLNENSIQASSTPKTASALIKSSNRKKKKKEKIIELAKKTFDKMVEEQFGKKTNLKQKSHKKLKEI